MMTRLLLILTGLSLVTKIAAQSVETPYETVDYEYDSGYPGNPFDNRPVEKTVRFEGAPWLRFHLDGTKLPPGATLRFTSALDGAQQFFYDASRLAEYRYTSAVFNGDEVLVEMLLGPNGNGKRRMRIPQVDVGLGLNTPESICGNTDDRVLSDDKRQGRQHPTGCTSWLISESVVLTAGHCTSNPDQALHLNVPLSTSSGSKQYPPPDGPVPLRHFHAAASRRGRWLRLGCGTNGPQQQHQHVPR